MLRLVVVSGLICCASVAPALAQQAQPNPDPAPETPSAQPAQKPKAVKPKPKKVTAPADPATDNKARLLEKIKDWTIFIHEDGTGRVCFTAAAPGEMQPKIAKRTPVIFYVTAWQKDGVRNEVSVKQGYALKAATPLTVTIGQQSFTLTADDDKAFIKDPADERKLVAAMSSGGTMAVKGTSAKGTATTDQYSLSGLAEALKKLQEVCP